MVVDKRPVLARLRAELARIEGWGRAERRAVLPFGVAAIDRALPDGGLAHAGLHELCGGAAAAGFATVLLGRLAQAGHVLWIGPRDEPYAPGLVELGLAPERLLVVRARARDARLWALEEAARSPGLAAALAEVDRLDLTRSRRLQLAAEAGGVTVFLLRPVEVSASSAALTRWRIASAPTAPPVAGMVAAPAVARHGPGAPCWQVALVRCRGGRTGRWCLAWHGGAFHEVADSVALAAGPGDRPAAPAGPARRRSA